MRTSSRPRPPNSAFRSLRPRSARAPRYDSWDDIEADVVLNGITGAAGLAPTLAVLATGETLALANKESLIIGGDLVLAAAAPGQLVPVDSEHSALAQALRSGTHAEVRRLIVTASGGPFRGWTRERMRGGDAAAGARAPDMGDGGGWSRRTPRRS